LRHIRFDCKFFRFRCGLKLLTIPRWN
jgi:hypothetical protein